MKSKLLQKWLILDVAYWLMVIVVLLFVFGHELQPTYEQEYMAEKYYNSTSLLYPGDKLVQPFSPTYDKLTGVGIAVLYEESIANSAQVTVQIMRGDTVVVEQPLQVNHIANGSFIPFSCKIVDCKDDRMYIVISNTSSDENSVFSVMSTDTEWLYLDNTEDYHINGVAYNERILCQFTYQDGWQYYEALTYAFLLFLAALLFYGKGKTLINRLNGKAHMA